MTFEESLEQYRAARVASEKALRKYRRAVAMCEKRKEEWIELAKKEADEMARLKAEAQPD